MLAVLRQRNFALLWFGGLVSLAGDWMLRIALPIYVYQLTGSALATGTMFMASLLPVILFGSLAGVFVDRWDRKWTMVSANLGRAVFLLPLVLVHSADSLWIVYLVAFAESVIGLFFGPAENALLPRLVAEDDLVTANALNALNNNLARLLGPPLGGFVAGLMGLTGVALMDSASYVIAALMIAAITAQGQPSRASTENVAEQGQRWGRLWSEWITGLRLIMGDRLVRTLFVMLSITAVGEGIFAVLLIVFINRELNGGATAFGFLMSAQAVGGLIGSAVIGWIGQRVSPAWLLGWCCLLFGIGDLAIINAPLIFPSFALVLILFVAVGIPGIGFGTSLDTLFQSGVADEYRGRIFGTLGTTQALLVLCGMLLGGTLGDPLGVIPVLNIQGGGYVVAGLIGLIFLPRILYHRQGSGERPVVTEVESFTAG